MSNPMAGKLLICEVQSGEAKHIVGSKDGRSWDFHTQTVYFASGQQYPNKIEWQLPQGVAPYPPGYYLLPAGTLSDGRKGVFVDRGFPLVPVADAIAELQGLGLGAAVPPRPIRSAA